MDEFTILPKISISRSSVFGSDDDTGESQTFLELTDWSNPVTYFAGRNGSGKSRTIKQVAAQVQGRILSTDRLVGLMNAINYGWTITPQMEGYKGVPIGESERNQARSFGHSSGSAVDEVYALREQPDVWLRVAAFVQRALGRTIELRENAGYIDPYVRVGSTEYSLFREEGHGLRELVVLLTAVYRHDWALLVVDEPELHLHPSLARTWLGELERVCSESGRRAIIVTHEPSLVRPKAVDDLAAIWHFALGRPPMRLVDQVHDGTHSRVTASLRRNPQLVSDLISSPRPVLVEGPHDVAAFSTALSRTQPSEVVAQTDLVPCGGSGGVALWFEIATKLGLDVKAVADLDALFSDECQRSMDRRSAITDSYRERFAVEPARTRSVLQSLNEEMGRDSVEANPAARRDWLTSITSEPPSGHMIKRDALIEIWRGQGMWLHPQGTLEDLLGLAQKSSELAEQAASLSGPIDEVVQWFAFSLDTSGEIALLLSARVEAIAHRVMEAQRVSPGQTFNQPVGQSAQSDSMLVHVESLGGGRHRIIVHRPDEFKRWWVEFDRDTPASKLNLSRPQDGVD